MKGNFRINKRPTKITIRLTVRNLPTGAEVRVTDAMFQPGGVVTGWMPHATELQWSAGVT